MEYKRKVLMIGNRNSGKTTYMSSSYGAMKAGKYGFTVYGDAETDAWLMALYSRIAQGQYPLPTTKRDQLDFQLNYLNQPVLSFQWVDHFGGIIDEQANSQFHDQLQALGKDIEEAHAIMIFLDAQSLAEKNYNENLLRKILYMISDKLADTEHNFDVIAVITKYDLVADSYHLHQVVLPLQHLEQSLNQRENIHFRIVPVSCTAKGFWNVELPLLDILCSGLQENYELHGHAAQEYREKAAAYYRKRNVLDYVVSKLLGLKTNGQLAVEYSQTAKDITSFWNELGDALKKLKAYRDNYQIQIPKPSGKYTPPPTTSAKNKSRFRNL